MRPIKFFFDLPWRTDPPHHSLDAMIQTMHRTPGPAAENTRKWFHEANRILAS